MKFIVETQYYRDEDGHAKPLGESKFETVEADEPSQAILMQSHALADYFAGIKQEEGVFEGVLGVYESIDGSKGLYNHLDAIEASTRMSRWGQEQCDRANELEEKLNGLDLSQ